MHLSGPPGRPAPPPPPPVRFPAARPAVVSAKIAPGPAPRSLARPVLPAVRPPAAAPRIPVPSVHFPQRTALPPAVQAAPAPVRRPVPAPPVRPAPQPRLGSVQPRMGMGVIQRSRPMLPSAVVQLNKGRLVHDQFSGRTKVADYNTPNMQGYPLRRTIAQNEQGDFDVGDQVRFDVNNAGQRRQSTPSAADRISEFPDADRADRGDPTAETGRSTGTATATTAATTTAAAPSSAAAAPGAEGFPESPDRVGEPPRVVSGDGAGLGLGKLDEVVISGPAGVS